EELVRGLDRDCYALLDSNARLCLGLQELGLDYMHLFRMGEVKEPSVAGGNNNAHTASSPPRHHHLEEESGGDVNIGPAAKFGISVSDLVASGGGSRSVNGNVRKTAGPGGGRSGGRDGGVRKGSFCRREQAVAPGEGVSAKRGGIGKGRREGGNGVPHERPGGAGSGREA
ncbi:unnamed protein product, partial [Choristocarpus tenellus]